ncbi:hypothetical protein [Aureimonas sp. AU4]|jgi:hypothetical protein|uniref:hypothetical protein n=1 Tax=Aureimonas sp. AU4 TaxID=1638163 RepID=UPI000785708E|nr:hypothetical protein [Aureimonas sp. AU4]
MSNQPTVREILQRIGAELAAQAGTAEGLGDLIPFLPALDAPLQARAQSIDALVQHLEELSLLLERLAPLAGNDPAPPEILDAVRLGDLSARLGGRRGVGVDSGALDLF